MWLPPVHSLEGVEKKFDSAEEFDSQWPRNALFMAYDVVYLQAHSSTQDVIGVGMPGYVVFATVDLETIEKEFVIVSCSIDQDRLYTDQCVPRAPSRAQ